MDQRKILIVDDIELNRAILGELFRGKYEILEAENGEEAINIIKTFGEQIAVVLLDIIMPVMDGFAVLEHMTLLGYNGRIPVVMITADTGAGAMQKSYELGASEVISKPFAPNIILQRVSNIVEQYNYKLHLEKMLAEQTAVLREQANKLRENSVQIIDVLSAVIEFKNTESVSHIHNIRTITRLLMEDLVKNHKEYNIPEVLVDIISEAAAMHDIGKVAIPDNILNKPGKLTTEEFDIMKTHTIRGCEILDKLSSVQHLEYFDYCYEICRHHHERWDGGGYPDGLKGDNIPIWAQVVSLADVYDALTSKRVYKAAYTSDTAVKMILSGECGCFNPILIESFLNIVPVIKDGVSNLPYVSESIHTSNSASHISGEDLTSRTLRLLELERQKYKIMSEMSGEILFEYDINADKLMFSEKYHELTGRNLEICDVLTKLKDTNLMPENDLSALTKSIFNYAPSNKAIKQEVQINLLDKGLEWYEVYLYPIRDTEISSKCIGFLGKLLNINEQKLKTLKLQAAVNSDPLTGLLNRSATAKLVSSLIAKKQVESGALCFVDIDNFKYINDNYGHPFGDKILKYVSSILTNCTRSTDIVGRMGGDEFVVFYKGEMTLDVIKKRFEQINSAFLCGYENCKISFSMGVAIFPRHGDTFEKLFLCADQALYMSKRKGKNQYNIYKAQK